MSMAAGASFAGSGMARSWEAETFGESVVWVGVGGWLAAKMEGAGCGKAVTGSARSRFAGATEKGGLLREGVLAGGEGE